MKHFILYTFLNIVALLFLVSVLVLVVGLGLFVFGNADGLWLAKIALAPALFGAIGFFASKRFRHVVKSEGPLSWLGNFIYWP